MLPAEYAEWEQQTHAPEPVARRTAADTARSDGRFQILSPRQGDRYRVPPGVDPRYATLALRAAGGDDAHPVRWFVDGRRLERPRWQLAVGPHVVRAERAGERQEVTVEVAP
jgi:membrane carboxypeptidase/penicillin-binding protein PbpC